MSTQTIGIIVIVILLISFLPNAYMLYKTSKEGTENTRYKLMVGVDAMLLVLIILCHLTINLNHPHDTTTESLLNLTCGVMNFLFVTPER